MPRPVHPLPDPDLAGAPADPRAWHGGCALGAAALAGLVLLLSASPPPAGRVWGLLGLAAAGAVAAAVGPRRAWLRAGLWTVAAALAAGLDGGVAGPLAPALLLPALAATATGAGAATATAASVAAVIAAVVLAPEAAPAAPVLRAAVLALAALAATFALPGTRRRASSVLWAPPPTGAEPFDPKAPEPPSRASLEAALAEAQAARAAAESRAEGRARFIAQVSHELRTPLNAVQGFSDIMRQRLFGPLPERYAEYAELIHESGAHLLEVINDVLDLSKIEADRYELRRERFDAREAVTAALRLLRVQAEEAGVRLRADLPPAAVPVDADRRALKQMVLNLAGNALKFTPRDGDVAVALRVAEGALELAVIDTGVGIAPEEVERLGRPYQQAAAGRASGVGTGLGLSLVRALARLHDGELAIDSRLGEGTAATVRLPVLAPAEPDLQAAPGTSGQPSLQPG